MLARPRAHAALIIDRMTAAETMGPDTKLRTSKLRITDRLKLAPAKFGNRAKVNVCLLNT